MNFSEETLMAYVDRQLDADTRAAIEAAMAADPELVLRVACHQKLADSVRAAFAPVLLETVPGRLLDAAAGITDAMTDADHRNAEVIDIAQSRREKHNRKPRYWSWPQWGAIAASLLMGTMIGRYGSIDSAPALFALEGGGVVAHGRLEHALSTQLAGTQPTNSPVKIGLSFVTKSGEYCRTFALAQGLAGLACNTRGNWRLPVMAQSETTSAAFGAYRMAASDMPPAVMREVEAEINGSPLDAKGEQSALQRGWRK